MQNTDCYTAEEKVEMRPFQDQSTTPSVISHNYTENSGKTCRSDVHFSVEVPNQFYCAICNHVLNCPIQTPCGHRVGKECLELLKRTKEPIVCPVDNEKIDLSSVFLDRFCEQEILKLQCNCKFSKNGCQWKGLLRHLENHIKDCEYLVEFCTNPGCTELVTKQNIEDHLKNQCNYRMTSCEDCKERFPLAERETHILRCPKAIISCTNECGSQVPRDQLDDHLTEECPLSEQQCSFASSGCEFKGARNELQEHGKEAMKEHLLILNTTAQKTLYQTNKQEDEIRNLKSVFSDLGIKMENQNEALTNAKQDLRTQQIKLGIMEKTVSEQKKELVTIRQKLDNCNGDNTPQSTQVTAQVEECMNFLRAVENRLGNMERHIDELKAGHLQQQGGARSLSLTASNMSIERRLERNEHGMAVQDVQLSEHDLKINMLETTSYDGQFIWKIDDWTRRYHEAVSGKSVSLYSAPFYLGRYGYKVCARLYPNGDGMGKGSHVSLFFVVMKGEYDALLRWPFKQKVAFQLYDQDHQLDVADAFRPDPNSSSFKRPTSNMNIASGCPLFISHADLYQRTYIRDDTMFIKITVDKTGIPPL